MLQPIINMLNKILKPLDNIYISTALSMFLIIYGAMARPELPNFIKDALKNDAIRLVYLFLLAYLSDKNPQVALVIAVFFMVGFGLLADSEVSESFEDAVEEEVFTDNGNLDVIDSMIDE